MRHLGLKILVLALERSPAAWSSASLSGPVPRTCLAAALLLALTTRLALGATPWTRDTFLANVQQLAARTDLRDDQEVGRRLGTDLGLRPYCADAGCTPGKVIGMARAFPDAPLVLPGDGGVSAQYYAPQSRPRRTATCT